MDCLHIEKAITFIAKGIREKENIEVGKRTPYYYSKDLQRGINMFLWAAFSMGGVGKNIYTYADEYAFLKKFICLPIREWFIDWSEESKRWLHLENEKFYYLDALAYRVGCDDIYRESDDCYAYLDGQESNIIESLDERGVYNRLKELSQEQYVEVRKFLIQNPIVREEERRGFVLTAADNVFSRAVIDIAYERFYESAYRCPTCGWTLKRTANGYVCHSQYCTENLPKLTDEMVIDGAQDKIYRLKKGVMRYIASPGKLEMEIVAFCKKNGLEYALWPQKDRYDVEIKFPNGDVWEIDAKAFRNPKMLSAKIEKDGGFPSGEYEKGFFVIPTDYVKGKNNYTLIVNKVFKKQKNVKCITFATLKKYIAEKVRKL